MSIVVWLVELSCVCTAASQELQRVLLSCLVSDWCDSRLHVGLEVGWWCMVVVHAELLERPGQVLALPLCGAFDV